MNYGKLGGHDGWKGTEECRKGSTTVYKNEQKFSRHRCEGKFLATVQLKCLEVCHRDFIQQWVWMAITRIYKLKVDGVEEKSNEWSILISKVERSKLV